MATATMSKNAFKVEYMQPFVDSLKALFDDHLGYPLTVGKLRVKENPNPSHEISGVITFTGTVIGRAVISFPMDVAENLTKDYLKMSELPDGVVPDAVGELANIIVGRAKSALKDHKITISPPTVIRGGNYTITMQRGAACLSIPCKCKHGELVLDLSIVDNTGG